MIPAATPRPTRTVVVVNAGTGDPSSTQLLADQLASRAVALATERSVAVSIRSLNLRPLAADISTALVSGFASPELREAFEVLQRADGLIAATPVYKAGASALLTSFLQVLDSDLLIGVPTVLAATGGSDRHALVIDDQIRGTFAFLRTLTTPTSVYATPNDWQAEGFSARIDRAATELVVLLEADFVGKLRDANWGAYQHSFGSAGGTAPDIHLSSDLMRLAAGGRA